MKENFEKMFRSEDEHGEWEAEGEFKLQEGRGHCAIQPPMKMEIIAEINKLRKNKSAAENRISVEILKCGGEILERELWRKTQAKVVNLINNAWGNEQMPLVWHTVIVP